MIQSFPVFYIDKPIKARKIAKNEEIHAFYRLGEEKKHEKARKWE